jgi:hypothetical protein
MIEFAKNDQILIKTLILFYETLAFDGRGMYICG